MDAALKIARHYVSRILDTNTGGESADGQNRWTQALQEFQYNAERNGDAWPVHVGLARAYMAKGDLKQARIMRRKPRSSRNESEQKKPAGDGQSTIGGADLQPAVKIVCSTLAIDRFPDQLDVLGSE